MDNRKGEEYPQFDTSVKIENSSSAQLNQNLQIIYLGSIPNKVDSFSLSVIFKILLTQNNIYLCPACYNGVFSHKTSLLVHYNNHPQVLLLYPIDNGGCGFHHSLVEFDNSYKLCLLIIPR